MIKDAIVLRGWLGKREVHVRCECFKQSRYGQTQRAQDGAGFKVNFRSNKGQSVAQPETVGDKHAMGHVIWDECKLGEEDAG